MKSRISLFALLVAALACARPAPPASSSSSAVTAAPSSGETASGGSSAAAPSPAAPSEADSSSSSESTERIRLHPGQSAPIAGTTARIAFDGVVSDSRCAIDVQCVQAGEAVVSLRLDRPGAMSVGFQLNTGETREGTVNGYHVVLVTLFPAPRSTVRIAPGAYVAEITAKPE